MSTAQEAPAMGVLKIIPLERVREAGLAVRHNVEKETEKYKNLLSSISKDGIINPIGVREAPDPSDPSKVVYILTDGLHRTTACKDAGMTEIPAYIRNVGEVEGFIHSFIGNLQRIETTGTQFTKALKEYLALDPTKSKSDIATLFSKSLSWVEGMLKLERLHPDVVGLVNEGAIKLVNAQALACLPYEKQVDYKNAAMSNTAVEFAEKVRAELSEISKAKRTGTKPGEATFVPKPRFQKLADAINESEALNQVAALLTQNNITTVPEAAKMALLWCVRMDPNTIAQGTANFEAEKEKHKAEAAARKIEKDKIAEKVKAELAAKTSAKAA